MRALREIINRIDFMIEYTDGVKSEILKFQEDLKEIKESLEDKDSLIVELRDKGLSYAKIAEKLDLSIQAVYHRYKKLKREMKN